MDWSNRAFTPTLRKCYEVDFGTQAAVLKRVRIDGPGQKSWLDLDTCLPLQRKRLAVAS